MMWLLIYLLVVSLYDWRTCRIPNWCTIPLILVGLIAKFPGSLDLWLACFMLVCAWTSGWMGAGDTKLWLALLWSLPDPFSPVFILFIFITFFITGLGQMIWRMARNQTVKGVTSTAAWRTIPFLLMVWYAH